MYICTIELGIQNKYISKSVKYVLFSNMFFKELSGNYGIWKLFFTKVVFTKTNIFTCDLLPHVVPYSTHFWLARISCNSVSARSSGSRGQNVYPPSECRFLCWTACTHSGDISPFLFPCWNPNCSLVSSGSLWHWALKRAPHSSGPTTRTIWRWCPELTWKISPHPKPVH